jgi:hypothetical protein
MNLSLEWFKSTAEKAIEKIVESKLEEAINQEENVSLEKPYIAIKLTNDVLIVVLKEGNVLTKPNATEEDFYAALEAKTESELRMIIASQDVINDVEARKKEEAKIKAIQQGIQSLSELNDFVVEENTVYLSGTSRSMPQLLVEKFIEIVDRVSEQTSGIELLKKY